MYQDVSESSNWQVFSSSTSLKLQKFTGLIYGGKTDNFRKHRGLLRRAFAKQTDNANLSGTRMSHYEESDF